jgi:hypothetical protein
MASLFILIGLGCSPESDDAPSTRPATQPDVADIANNYRRLEQVTREPVYVNFELAILCRGASQAEVDTARKQFGPHAHTAISIYMNDAAARSFKENAPTYPVGSIIVKEKKALSYRAGDRSTGMTKAHDGVGGMIKRPPGYDSQHGDWEYFYFEDPRKIERGKIASCVQCHAGAAAKDYVFGNWARLK